MYVFSCSLLILYECLISLLVKHIQQRIVSEQICFFLLMLLGKLKNLTLNMEVNIANHKTQNLNTFDSSLLYFINSLYIFHFKILDFQEYVILMF